MEVAVNLTSNKESNIFLRSLWAEFRRIFGRYSWQYIPRKDGKHNRIYLGYLGIGINRSKLRISIGYKKKGILDKLFFEGLGEEISRELSQDLLDAVNQSFEQHNRLDDYYFQNSFSSIPGAFLPYTGRNFKLYPINDNTTRLSLKIQGFDEIDAQAEYQKLVATILDFLSVCTNAEFIFTDVEMCKDTQTGLNEEVFFQETDWIDNHPRIGDRLALWKVQKEFIECIVANNIDLEHPFLRACRHFHAAQRLRAKGSHLINSMVELSSVLYVSALEVVAELYSAEGSRCSKCGQMSYSMRKRVKELTRTHINEFIEEHIDNYYAIRSKYLHVGILSSSIGLVGASIPQLDPSSESGCRTMPPAINLGEFVSYILRSVFTSKVIHTIY